MAEYNIRWHWKAKVLTEFNFEVAGDTAVCIELNGAI